MFLFLGIRLGIFIFCKPLFKLIDEPRRESKIKKKEKEYKVKQSELKQLAL